MMLQTVKGTANIPEGAVRVTRDEALMHQKEIVRDWRNHSETFFLRYSSHFATYVASISSFFILKHIKAQYFIKNWKLLVYGPQVLTSAAIMSRIYERDITDNILVMRMKCPLCQQIKYCLKHLFLTIAQSTFIGVLACSCISIMNNIEHVPDVKNEYKKFFSFTYKKLSTGFNLYRNVAAINIVIIMSLPYLQNRELANIMKIVNNQEILQMNA